MKNSPGYAEAKKAIYRRASFKKRYGITVERYEEMLQAQGGVCAICRTHTTAKRLAVDHDHKTGEVRGLLCSRCNAGIGQFRESLELLDSAKAYLSGYRPPQTDAEPPSGLPGAPAP